MVNTTIALAVLVTLGAGLIKVYKLDPEPVLLLLMHAAISGSMLVDPATSSAVLTALITLIVAFGEGDLPADRVAVFLVSLTASVIFGNVAAFIISIAIAIGIIILKLRPLRPPTLTLLALGVMALGLLLNKLLGLVLVFLLIAIITALFVFNKVCKKGLGSYDSTLDISPVNGSANITGYLPLSNPTESLDLQGRTVTGAMKALHAFLREHEEEYRMTRSGHIRHVTVITGDVTSGSLHETANLIKPTVVNFLKINKYKHEISKESPGLIKVDLESHAL